VCRLWGPGARDRANHRGLDRRRAPRYEVSCACGNRWRILVEDTDTGWQQIDAGQRAAGYRDERVTVVGPDGAEHDASVYVARAEMIDDSMMPMKSYRDPIVNAARASGLPPKYVDELARTPAADS
jgi:hypothetical protein